MKEETGHRKFIYLKDTCSETGNAFEYLKNIKNNLKLQKCEATFILWSKHIDKN